MKLKQLVDSIESLNVLVWLKLPVGVSYNISLLILDINPKFKLFNIKRNELLEEFAINEEKDWEKIFHFETIEKQNKFNDVVSELLDQEIDLNIPTIYLKDLWDIEIEPKNLINLTWLIKSYDESRQKENGVPSV